MNIRDPHQYQKVRDARRNDQTTARLIRWLKFIIVIIMVFALVGYASYARALPALTGQPLPTAHLPAKIALNWPTDSQSAIGVLGQGVLAENSDGQPLPTASVAKIMLALTILRKHPLKPGQSGPMIKISQTDVDNYNNYLAVDGSVVPVQVGEQLSLYQALQGLLLPSANNIAQTLAVWAFGSVEKYCTAANQLAQDLGMTSSKFADASGFAPETVSTPHDLVLMGQAALQNKLLADIVAQPSAILPVAGTIYNTNFMLGRNGIIGLKTGNTDQAGGVYLFAARHTLSNGHPITAIGVIMGAKTLYQAGIAAPGLLDSFYQTFGQQAVVRRGEVLARYQTPWGSSTEVVAASDLKVFGWPGSPPNLAIKPAKIVAPAAAGQSAGTVIASTPYGQSETHLKLKSSLASPGWQWRLFRH